jgi:hypothetical protein
LAVVVVLEAVRDGEHLVVVAQEAVQEAATARLRVPNTST